MLAQIHSLAQQSVRSRPVAVAVPLRCVHTSVFTLEASSEEPAAANSPLKSMETAFVLCSARMKNRILFYF